MIAIAAILLVCGVSGYYIMGNGSGPFSSGTNSSSEDLRGEAEPYFQQARTFEDRAGRISPSLHDLSQMLQETIGHLETIMILCEDPTRELLQSAADDYREAILQIRGGGGGKESIQSLLRRADQRIHDVRPRKMPVGRTRSTTTRIIKEMANL